MHGSRRQTNQAGLPRKVIEDNADEEQVQYSRRWRTFSKPYSQVGLSQVSGGSQLTSFPTSFPASRHRAMCLSTGVLTRRGRRTRNPGQGDASTSFRLTSAKPDHVKGKKTLTPLSSSLLSSELRSN